MMKRETAGQSETSWSLGAHCRRTSCLAVIAACVELNSYLRGSISVSSVTMHNPSEIDIHFFLWIYLSSTLCYKTVACFQSANLCNTHTGTHTHTYICLQARSGHKHVSGSLFKNDNMGQWLMAKKRSNPGVHHCHFHMMQPKQKSKILDPKLQWIKKKNSIWNK